MQLHAHGDLGGDARDRIAARLGGQGRGARDAWVHLDHEIGEGLRIERELHVAAALDAQRADDLQRAVAQHVVFLVGQRLAGRNNDRVAGVDADRVEVLHAAHGDGRVVRVAHDLELDLLVALDALLDQHLMDRGERKGVFHHRRQLIVIAGKAATGAAKRKRGPQDDRVTDLMRGGNGFLHGVGDVGRDDRLADALAELLEQLAVLGCLDALGVGAQQLDAALLQHALLGQLHSEVEAGLTADAGDNRVRALKAADARHIFERQRLHIDLVRNGGIRHDGRRVGIDEDNLVALLAQRKASLRASIVELRRLSDDDRAGADDQHLVKICTLRHRSSPPPSSQ